MNNSTNIKIFFLLIMFSLILTSELVSKDKSYIEISVEGDYSKKYKFVNEISVGQIMMQSEISSNSTLGFFTDRNPKFPFLFSCVLANLKDFEINKNTYQTIAVVDEIPVYNKNIPVCCFLTLTINDKTAKKREYFSTGEEGNFVEITNTNDEFIFGTISSILILKTDSTKKLKVSGKFKINKSK